VAVHQKGFSPWTLPCILPQHQQALACLSPCWLQRLLGQVNQQPCRTGSQHLHGTGSYTCPLA
jgi:hypothetical protein